MGIIKKTRTDVALNCSTMGEISPEEYAALVIVELLPAVGRIRKDEDSAEFRRLLNMLEALSKRVRRHHYSKDAMLSLVKGECLSGKSVYDLSEMIGNSAFCMFPTDENEPMFFRSVSRFPPALRSDYGDEPYVATADETTRMPSETADETTGTPSETAAPPRVKKEPVPASKGKLGDLPEIVALKRKYHELERPDERYIWKWRVSTEDYDDFKRLLLDVDFSSRTREKVRECAYQLCFYIAEWYKREYDGNDSDNCLTELGIEGSGLTEEIWKYSPRSHDEQPYITEGTKFHEWLYSIYVLGGFPIKYTLRASRFSSLFDEIWGEDQNRDVISDDQLDEITRGFAGNQVVKNSLVSGSLHDYYRYLRKETTMPIAPSDLDKEPFASFIRNLQEGKRKYYEHYLKPTWLLYVDPHDGIIEGEVQVSFGRKDDNCYIPTECLSYWNIPGAKTLDGFEIEVSDSSSGVKKSIRFSKTGPDDYPYAGWSRRNVVSLPVAVDDDCSIEVYLVTCDGRYRIGDTYAFGSSRQFYKTRQPYEWSSRTDNTSHTAVLFNPAELTLRDSSFLPEEKTFFDGGRVWDWLVLTEEVSLWYGSGESVKYAPRNSSLEIIFKKMPNTVKYTNFRDVVHHQFIDGEHLQTAVTLLKRNGFSIRYTPFGSEKPENVPLSKCSISYKRPGDTRFVAWDEANQPGQGVMQLRAIYDEKGVSATRLVYYLPQYTPIKRVTDGNLISFGQGLRDIYAPGAEEYVPLDRDAEDRPYYHDDIVKGYSPQSDTIPFIFGKPDDDHVTIDVYRSAECKELYLKGAQEPIKRYGQGTGIVDIPVILRGYFEVRTINSSGVSRVKCGEDVYLRYDLPIYENDYTDNEKGLRYYLAKRTVVNDTDNEATFVLETSPDQYRFFYWSMNMGEEPVSLGHKSYDPADKHLVIDISPLRKNNKGIIFQSLKGVTPRHYFGPILGNQRDSLYGRRKTVQCFDVASEHNVPFVLFPCLKDLFLKKDVPFYLAKFWVELMESRNWKPTSRDLTNLHRFAYEFLFDWIMLPKFVWSKRTREWIKLLLDEKDDSYRSMANRASGEIMLNLFRTSPYVHKDDKMYLEKTIEKYRAFKPGAGWEFHRSRRPENILAQCIRGNGSDYSCFDTDYEKRLSNLKSLHEDKALYEGLYRLMTGKYK